VTPADGKPAETKKARYVVALSRVLRSTRETPPGSSPSDNSATTGTCEFGQAKTYARIVSDSRIFTPGAKKSRAPLLEDPMTGVQDIPSRANSPGIALKAQRSALG